MPEFRAAITLAAVLLGGCAQATPTLNTRYWAGQQQETPQTPACRTGLPPFGVSLSQGLYPPEGSMATQSDGSWCALNVAFTLGSPYRVEIVQPPSHGVLRIEPVPGGLSLRYRAAAGYDGPDLFRVRTGVGGRDWTIPVSVTVTG